MREYFLNAPNVNTLWARVIIDELARAGVRHAVISPGSRSTPLTLAAAEHPDIADTLILDERSAAFFALGLGKESGVPAALICTSGTAAANYYPAVCEAHASGVPMVLLTADRPSHLRESGAPQTMDQLRLYGEHVNWFMDLAQPEADEFKLRALRSTVSHAFSVAACTNPGPVHLNVPFRKPLEPVFSESKPYSVISETAKKPFGEGAFGSSEGGAFTVYRRPKCGPLDSDIEFMSAMLRQSKRPLIVAGPDSTGWKYRTPLYRFSRYTHIPVCAEALSNVRFCGGTQPFLVANMDLLLRSATFRQACKPDLIVRLGAAPTNQPMQDFLGAMSGVPQIQVAAHGNRVDPEFTTTHYFMADPGLFFDALLVHCSGSGRDSAWQDWIMGASVLAHTAASKALNAVDDLCKPLMYSELVSMIPENAVVMLSNSMPVRDFESWAMPAGTSFRVACNRGVNGIDGVTSTALGMARARGGNSVLITGDLAFLHDLNAFWAARSGAVNATIIVVNNNGGEIFRLLPVHEFEPPFTKHFTTPHRMDLSKAGELYGLEYYKAKNVYQLQTFLRISMEAPGVQIIEVPSDPEREPAIRKRIIESVAAELDALQPYEIPVSQREYPLRFTRLRFSERDSAQHTRPHTGKRYTGTPVLLLHGFTRSAASWKAAVSHMNKRRAFTAADLMGHGLSPAPRFEDAPFAFSIEYQADQLHQWFRSHHAGKIHLTGYSMGGRTALYYALRYPETLATLALVSASPGIERPGDRAARAERDASLADRIVHNGMEAFVEEWSNSEIIGEGIPVSAQALIKRERLSQRAEGLRGSLLGMGQGVQPELWSSLTELQIPVLLLAGVADEQYRFTMSAMAQRIPNARMHSIEGAGHDILSAAPEELAHALESFWEEND